MPSPRALSSPASASLFKWWLSVDAGRSTCAWISPAGVPASPDCTTNRRIARRTGWPNALNCSACRSNLEATPTSNKFERVRKTNFDNYRNRSGGWFAMTCSAAATEFSRWPQLLEPFASCRGRGCRAVSQWHVCPVEGDITSLAQVGIVSSTAGGRNSGTNQRRAITSTDVDRRQPRPLEGAGLRDPLVAFLQRRSSCVYTTSTAFLPARWAGI